MSDLNKCTRWQVTLKDKKQKYGSNDAPNFIENQKIGPKKNDIIIW